MTRVVGIRWRTADPISYADAVDLEMHRLRETVSVRYSDDEVLEWPLVDVKRNVPSKN